MRITVPHTHACPKCKQSVPCPLTEKGDWCLFPSEAAITCEACVEQRFGGIR